MSDKDMTESSIWADVSGEQLEAKAVDIPLDSDGGGFDQNGFDDQSFDDQGVVDAEATEVKKKPKFKVVYVIALIGVLGLGFAGYIGYSLYSKLFGGQGSVDTMASNVALVDTSAPLPAVVAAPAGADQQTLPVGEGTAPTDVPALADAKMVPLEAAPSPVAAAVPAPAVAEPAVPVATAPVTAPSTPAAPVLPAPTVAAVNAPSAAICPPVNAAPVCPSASNSNSTLPLVKRAAPRRVAKAYKPKAKVAAKVAAPAAVASTPNVQDVSAGRLSGFKVLAIEPKSGDHQQAWIRGRDGKMYIVREGDTFQGARVMAVRFDDGAVKTTAGDIRK